MKWHTSSNQRLQPTSWNFHESAENPANKVLSHLWSLMAIKKIHSRSAKASLSILQLVILFKFFNAFINTLKTINNPYQLMGKFATYPNKIYWELFWSFLAVLDTLEELFILSEAGEVIEEDNNAEADSWIKHQTKLDWEWLNGLRSLHRVLWESNNKSSNEDSSKLNNRLWFCY